MVDRWIIWIILRVLAYFNTLHKHHWCKQRTASWNPLSTEVLWRAGLHFFRDILFTDVHLEAAQYNHCVFCWHGAALMEQLGVKGVAQGHLSGGIRGQALLFHCKYIKLVSGLYWWLSGLTSNLLLQNLAVFSYPIWRPLNTFWYDYSRFCILQHIPDRNNFYSE